MVSKDSNGIRHYFDWAATAPHAGIASDAPFGNPSSQHKEGREAKLVLEDARKRCAAVLNVPPNTLYFTSGGTESNSIAVLFNLLRKGQGRVISSLAEHSSIREGMETLVKMGKPTGNISIDSSGRANADFFENALKKYGDVRFAAVMAVNNETGAVTDIASLREIKKRSEPGIHFHCDMVQAVGKIPFDIPLWEIDSASISAHKIGGPRGIGLLYLRRPVEVFYTGGGQENRIRGGSENTQGAVELASCLEQSAGDKTREEYARAKTRWNKLITSLAAIDRCTIIPQERLGDKEEDGFSPYILQVAFRDIPGEVMARALDDLGFAVSTGSACSSSSPERPVLAAMGISEKLRIEGIRISQGWTTTDAEIDLLLDAINEVLKFL
ncbi:MAG: aminotransferase class V-fold PLP-dependent enzyme [Treponema sp.]|jgi:cysteine desulfurase|nr:aminotransferase class V-fold PLP-dependent enzyme [Treponema sp.]